MSFSDEDRQQFAQLIGYSLSGYSELSYVDNESYGAAEKMALGQTRPASSGWKCDSKPCVQRSGRYARRSSGSTRTTFGPDY